MSPNNTAAYSELELRFERIAVLGEIATILNWDAATQMPPSAAGCRGDQLAEIRLIRHRALTDPALDALLETAGDAALTEWQAANLREMAREYQLATALNGRPRRGPKQGL